MQGFMRLETVEQNARIAYMLAQLGVSNPLPPEEISKLLAQRAEMGLCRPGEAEEFCAVCGVCHTGNEHFSTMRSGNSRSKLDKSSTYIDNNSAHTGSPHALPPIGQPLLDANEIRDLVSQVVQKTLGN